VSYRREGGVDAGVDTNAPTTTAAPGKRSRTAALQRKATRPPAGASLDAHAIAAEGVSGAATALPHADQIQAAFGRHSIAGIEAHVGGRAAAATSALGADGYATGNAVAFADAPSLHTAAHEAAHVIQQRAGVHLKGGLGEAGDVHERHADAVADAVVRGESAEALLDSCGGGGGGSGGAVQRHIRHDHVPVPGMGIFDMDFRAIPSPTPGPNQQAGMDGFIHFTPVAGAPNSNVIGINQIVKLTREAQPTNDVAPGSLSPNAQPRGALGQRGLRTQDDAATGVEGGYFTDVLHQGGTTGLHPGGQPLSPRYAVEPASPANQAGAWGGTTPGPNGGTGGIGEQSRGGLTPGFKRSDLPEDIRSVSLFDTPGWSGNGDFSFESVVRGEDTSTFYVGVTWGFTSHDGTVINERSAITHGTSATFENAMDRHRDFYVHEPVVIYFAFDHEDVDAVQTAKITALTGYLSRNPQVQMTLDGFADVQGDAAYNVRLSERRVAATRAAIVAAHPTFPAAQIVVNTVVPTAGAAAARPGAGGHGESTGATDATSEVPAGTGDQGGDAANGADQTREANRQFNRRVTITFSHPAGTGPTTGTGAATPVPPPAPAHP
jgi:outer membrane protein OmpA-like peptidoglycan-associated protein